MQTNKQASEKTKNESEEVVKWIEDFYSLFNLMITIQNIKDAQPFSNLEYQKIISDLL